MLSSRVIGGTWIGIGIAGACAVLALATSWVPGFEIFGPSSYHFDAALAGWLLAGLGLSAFVSWSGYALSQELPRARIAVLWASTLWLLMSFNLIVFASEVAGRTPPGQVAVALMWAVFVFSVYSIVAMSLASRRTKASSGRREA